MIFKNPMKAGLSAIFLLGLSLIFDGCTSGKGALKHGDYYEAVMESVQRLRQNPDHKKSKEVLHASYTLAVEYLETSAQNAINSNANFKWKTAVQNYDKINNLYENIRTSPGAMKVIPNPVNRYKELTDLKAKAAEESYEAGIQALLKNTRDDAKQAYFLFSEANTFSPGYREAIEMITQAEFNATLRVVFEELNTTRVNLGSFQPSVMALKRQFLNFYPISDTANIKAPVDHQLRMIFSHYGEDRPNTTSRSENRTDSVKTGEKEVNGVKKPVFQKVTAKITYYDKICNARADMNVNITDNKTGSTLKNNVVSGGYAWKTSWATYTGDIRALTDAQKKLCEKRETNPSPNDMMNQVRIDLDRNLNRDLKAFYSKY